MSRLLKTAIAQAIALKKEVDKKKCIDTFIKKKEAEKKRKVELDFSEFIEGCAKELAHDDLKETLGELIQHHSDEYIKFTKEFNDYAISIDYTYFTPKYTKELYDKFSAYVLYMNTISNQVYMLTYKSYDVDSLILCDSASICMMENIIKRIDTSNYMFMKYEVLEKVFEFIGYLKLLRTSHREVTLM